jgi:hypothetical protein
MLRIRMQRFKDVQARNKHKRQWHDSKLTGKGVQEDIALRVNGLRPADEASVKRCLGLLVGSDHVMVNIRTQVVWLRADGWDKGERRFIVNKGIETLRRTLNLEAEDMGVVQTLETAQHVLGTEAMLKQYESTDGSIMESVAEVANDILSLLNGVTLWQSDIKRLSHSLGHGIAELLKICK